MLHVTAICADCTSAFIHDESSAATLPCPVCGSTKRRYDTSGSLVASDARVGLHLKARHPGKKKPHVELKLGPSPSQSLQKHVEHRRLIDRDNDQYSELVRDYETGEEIHKV